MAVNKKEAFSKEDQQIAVLTKALSHPARVSILRVLAEKDSCICGDLVDSLPLAQSTVSQHLKELKLAGLIKGSIDGPRSCYCIDVENWKAFEGLMKKFLDDLESVKNQQTCC